MTIRILRIIFSWVLCMVLASGKTDIRSRQLVNDESYRVYAVYVDEYGTKWFGTNRGLLRYTGHQWTYYTDQDFLSGNRVNALVIDKQLPDPALWIGTDGGASKVFFDVNGITSAISFTTAEGLADDEVEDIAIDSRGRIFLGSGSGITIITDTVTDTLTYAQYPGSMYSTPVLDLFIYGDTLYIAQDGGIGRFVSEVDAITGASRWGDEPSYGVSPYTRDIRSILVKGETVQFFGSGAGVEVHWGYQPKQNWDLWTTDQGLVHNEVISIKEDSAGGVWFGTNGGVSHLSGESWMSYTSADGLLNDTVFDIGFDIDGSVWFGTASGACRLKNGIFQDFITAVQDLQVVLRDLDVYFLPANNVFRIRYTLERKGGSVECRLFDSSGRMVAAWDGLSSLQGENQADLTIPSSLPGGMGTGIYIFQLISNESLFVKRIVIQ